MASERYVPRDDAMTVNVVITREAGAKETWYVATNLTDPDQAKRRYEQRFEIEETFKDAKHQLGLEYLKLTKIERVGKLVAAVLVALVVLLYLGVRAQSYRWLVDSGTKLSLISLALMLLSYPPPHFRRSCLAALRQAEKGSLL